VVAGKPTVQRVAELRDLLAQLAPRELREERGIPGALHQRLEHGPAGNAEDVRDDRRELDAGILQDLVEPLCLARPLLDLRLAIVRISAIVISQIAPS